MTEIFKNTRDFFEKGNVKVFQSGKEGKREESPEYKAWMQTLVRNMGKDAFKKVNKAG